jgi:hypothetical protein
LTISGISVTSSREGALKPRQRRKKGKGRGDEEKRKKKVYEQNFSH